MLNKHLIWKGQSGALLAERKVDVRNGTFCSFFSSDFNYLHNFSDLCIYLYVHYLLVYVC